MNLNSFLQPRDADDADRCLDWEVQLTKELTNVLSINAETDMGDEVWHDVAKQLGYTPREISNFSTNDNPMEAVIRDYKRRGGIPHQFITALYKTGSPGNVVKQKMNNRTGSTRIVEEDTSGESLFLCDPEGHEISRLCKQDLILSPSPSLPPPPYHSRKFLLLSPRISDHLTL